MLGEIFEKTNSEKFPRPPESPQKSEENRFVRDNGESITSTLECRQMSVVEHMLDQFVDNFSLHVFKEKKATKSIIVGNDEILTNNVVLTVLSDESEIKYELACNEEDEYEMPIVINCDI